MSVRNMSCRAFGPNNCPLSPEEAKCEYRFISLRLGVSLSRCEHASIDIMGCRQHCMYETLLTRACIEPTVTKLLMSCPALVSKQVMSPARHRVTNDKAYKVGRCLRFVTRWHTLILTLMHYIKGWKNGTCSAGLHCRTHVKRLPLMPRIPL